MTQVPEEDIQIGGEVYFVPRKQTGEFDLRLGSSLLGQYTGDNTETMWKCTAKGFEYVGRIVSAISGLGGTTVTCEVDTHRRET